MEKPMIEISAVTKTFSLTSGPFNALHDISLTIRAGQLVAITGKSGSGKSTLLNLIAGIDKPSTGAVSVNGVRVDKLRENELALWRGRNIGIVFQFFQLLPTLTILENVMLPMDFCHTGDRHHWKARASALLEIVGIGEQADKFPSALSGGQQQRAAIARALANDPSLIVADEPTGNLDSQTTTAIFNLFAKLAQTGKTVVVVTHEKELSAWFEHTIMMTDGSIHAKSAC
jgi:putative ABC transport system ATP-binding protein